MDVVIIVLLGGVLVVSVLLLLRSGGKAELDTSGLEQRIRGDLSTGLGDSRRESSEDAGRLRGEVSEQLDRVRTSLVKSTDQLRATLDERVREMQEGNEKKLEQMRHTVDEKLHDTLEKRLGESFKLVSERLEAVQKGLGEMQEEIQRAVAQGMPTDPDYPMILANGLRTRWTANTIQRDPGWRKGRGPHCALSLSPGDAERLDVADGDTVRVSTRRASVELPASVDKRMQDGHVAMPNGFGMKHENEDGELVMTGVNMNELSDAAVRDPFTGCPYHRYQPCQVDKVA